MIALYNGKSPVSRVIQFINWNKYSHASWVDDENDELLKSLYTAETKDAEVIEAWHKGGVRRTKSIHADHTPGTVIDLFSIKLTRGERQALVEFYDNQVGKMYDFRGVLKFISRRDDNNMDRWFCSEMIFAGFLRIRKPLLLRVPARKVYPGLLAYSPHLRHRGRIWTKAAKSPDVVRTKGSDAPTPVKRGGCRFATAYRRFATAMNNMPIGEIA